jgi:hypothetical protein
VRVTELAAVDGGWHEAADAGLTHLLRTVLAKNAREVPTATDGVSLFRLFPLDTSFFVGESLMPVASQHNRLS